MEFRNISGIPYQADLWLKIKTVKKIKIVLMLRKKRKIVLMSALKTLPWPSIVQEKTHNISIFYTVTKSYLFRRRLPKLKNPVYSAWLAAAHPPTNAAHIRD